MSLQIKEKTDPFADEVTPTAPEKKTAPKPKSDNPMEYKRVRFHAKSSKDQMNDVILSLNGLTHKIKREDEVVLPVSFLKVADEAAFEQYQTGTGSRKVAGKIRMYPYDVLGIATKAEYMAQRSAGNAAEEKAQREATGAVR